MLSTGFQENIAKLEIGTKQIQNIEVKKQRFEEIKLELSKEKTILDKDISQLRNALSTNTTTQSAEPFRGRSLQSLVFFCDLDLLYLISTQIHRCWLPHS